MTQPYSLSDLIRRALVALGLDARSAEIAAWIRHHYPRFAFKLKSLQNTAATIRDDMRAEGRQGIRGDQLRALAEAIADMGTTPREIREGMHQLWHLAAIAGGQAQLDAGLDMLNGMWHPGEENDDEGHGRDVQPPQPA